VKPGVFLGKKSKKGCKKKGRGGGWRAGKSGIPLQMPEEKAVGQGKERCTWPTEKGQKEPRAVVMEVLKGKEEGVEGGRRCAYNWEENLLARKECCRELIPGS